MGLFFTLITFIAGYIYVENSHLARNKHSRLLGWRSYYHIAARGILFSIAAGIILFLIMLLMDRHGYTLYPLPVNTDSFLKKIWQLKYVASLAWVVIACLIAWLTGSYYSTQKSLDEAIDRINSKDMLSDLVYRSILDTKIIQISTDQGKVYVGFALNSIVRDDDFTRQEYLAILPLESGYREKETLKMILNNSYESFYLAEKIEELLHEDFRVVIPVSEIVGAAFFNKQVHAYISDKKSTDVS